MASKKYVLWLSMRGARDRERAKCRRTPRPLEAGFARRRRFGGEGDDDRRLDLEETAWPLSSPLP